MSDEPSHDERWRLLSSASLDLIWDWDLDSGAVWRSDGISQLGYPPEEVEPTHDWWMARVHEDDRRAISEALRTTLAGSGTSWRCEYRLRRGDGRWAFVLDRATILRDPAGRAVRLAGLTIDLTERRTLEEELRAGRELLLSTLAGVEDAVWSQRPDGTMRYLSPATERIYGRPFPASAEVRRVWREAIHPDDRERAERELEERIRSGQGRSVYRIVRPDGEVRWLSARLRVNVGPDGSPQSIDGISSDITDQVHAELQLEAEKQALEQIVQGAPLGDVLALLCRSLEERFNQALCSVQLLDSSGLRLVEAAGPSLPAALRAALADIELDGDPLPPALAASSGKPLLVEDLARSEVSAWRELCAALGLSSCWSYPILDGERRVIGVFSVFHRRPRRADDPRVRQLAQTATLAGLAVGRKRIEAQLLTANRLASVGTLADGMAHEINNPLAFILGNVNYLRSRLGELASLPGAAVLAREMDEALADCAEGSRRIESIVRDLRSFSRTGDEEIVAVDVRRALEFAVRMVFNEVRHRARLVRDYDDAPMAMADEGRLVQVVVNLLVNAAQAMPERSSDDNEVTLSAREEDGHAVIEVRDNGVGIPPEMRPRIFDPFFTTRPVGQGTGLGLAISHGLTTSMKGTISVDSAPGLGSSFRVVLPLAPPEVQRPPEIIEPPSQRTQQRLATGARRQRLLVIDDETLVGTSIRRLVGARYDVVHVDDARLGLEMAKREPFDAILCDLMMPVLTGMDVHEALESALPEVARRTGFITGGAFTARARAFAKLHGDRLLQKPFSAESIEALIQQLAS